MAEDERDYVTARLHTGKRHILPPNGQRSLCGGYDGGWEGKRRPLIETKIELICQKCMRALAKEIAGDTAGSVQDLAEAIAAGDEI